MQKVTAWAQDALGRILAEVEMTPVRSRQTSPAYWVDGRLEMEDAATGIVVSLGPSDHLTIRRRVHPGARLYVGRIAASLVEATWPLSGEKPVWAAEMRKQDGDWYIFVSMVRPGLVTALNHAAEAKGLTLEAITADRQTFPNPDTRRKWTDPTRLRLALIGALAAIAAPDDLRVDKYQMSGFWDTPLESVLRTTGRSTLFFAGVNADQCVLTTLQDASFLGFDCILLCDCTATSSPDFCMQATLYNVSQCFGFVSASHHLLPALAAVVATRPDEAPTQCAPEASGAGGRAKRSRAGASK